MFGIGMLIMRSVNGVLCVSSMTMSISMDNLWAYRTEMHLGLTSSKEAGDTNTSKEAGDTNSRLPSVEQRNNVLHNQISLSTANVFRAIDRELRNIISARRHRKGFDSLMVMWLR
uniref:Uncharacterized protein n=1 Tax=Brassica oleracea var. oleracea TaxID=109376 RepID=A0A0D3E2T1_BRAOL